MEAYREQKTLLLVDDESVNRNLLKKVFISEYNILEATDGFDALCVLRSYQGVTAVLLDLNMPNLDGFGVLEQMQRDSTLSAIPVIVITVSDDSDVLNRALACGAVDVMTKPFHPVTIRLQVNRLIALLGASKLEEENKWLKELVYLSETDAKTGLWNKQTFCTETQKLLAADPDGAYVVVRWDIDNFKVFNDTYGTQTGDELLLKIGEQCRLYEKSHPALCTQGHYDADYFVSLWQKESVDPERLYRDVIEMLRNAFADCMFSVHVGLYAFDGQTFDVGIMCDRALLALRSVKSAYDVHYAWYCEAMRTEVIQEQSIVSVMKQALSNGEFIPYFQPQYNYATGELIGAEALVRWKRPETGLIPPNAFIPIFEKNGFIFEMDRYIWERVCFYLKKWQDKGYTVPSVSVNISRRDLYHPGLVDVFKTLIHQYGLDASMLHMEITESAYVDNPDLVLSIVDEMQSAGFKVEMDDFGSGYSSLNTLKDVHVDLLKLDMAFITPNANHSRSGSILTSVVGMAHAIRLPVIAEGVETRQQADYLKSIGCRYMQGYYFSRPMPAEEFENLLCNHPVATAQDARFKPRLDHSVDFLDATTQSTLLFNSFVGGAAILEYRGGNVAALRLNDRYYEVLGISNEAYKDMQYHMVDTIAPDYRKVFLRTLDRASSTGDEADCELCTVPLTEGADPLYLRCQVRFLAEKVDSQIFYLSIENITERMTYEKQNDMYRSIILNLPIGVAVYELREKVWPRYINDITCEMFGFTRAEYDERLAENMPVNFVPIAEELSSDDFRRLEAGEVLATRFRARKKNGEWFWLRSMLHLVRHEQEPPLLYASFIDITQVVDGEARIAKQQKELSAIIDSVPGGIFKYAAVEDDQFTFVSDTMLAMLGYTKEEFTQKFHNRFSEMVYPKDWEETISKINNDIAHTGSTDSCEYRIETKSGALKWVYDAGHLITDEHGDQWYIVVIVDIDERKELQMALEAANRKNDALLDNTPNGIVCYQYKNGQKSVEYANKSLYTMLGYTREELFGEKAENDAHLVHPDDLQELRAAKERMIETGAELRQQCRIRKKDGSYLWVSINGNYLMQAPGTGMFYGSYSDISEMKLLQEQQRQDRQQIEMLLASIPGGLGTYQMRPDGFRVLYASKGVPEISGRTMEAYLELFNEQNKTDVYPADEQMLRDHLREAMVKGSDIDLIYRVLHKSGRIVWVDMHGAMKGTHEGYPVFHAVFHNPSKTTELYRAIIDEADNVLTVTDWKTKELLFANKAAEQLDGTLYGQTVGKHCYEFLYHKDAPCEFCMASPLRDTPLCQQIDRDGRHYFCRMTRVNWNGHDAFITYLADQTELYASQEKIKTVLENIPGGVATFHVVGDHIKRTYISDGALCALGYEKDEPIDNDIFGALSRIYVEDRAQLAETIRNAAEMRVQFNMDMRVVLRTGGIRWVNLLANPVEMDGELYFYGIYSDVTLQKRAKESALAEREKQIAAYQQELRQLAEIQNDDLVEKLGLDLTDGILESLWVKDGAGINYDGVADYAEVVRRMVSSGLLKSQQETISRTMDRDRLLSGFGEGESKFRFEFQRRNAGGRIYWVSSTVKTYLDPESGHMKVFLYTYDIDGKKTPALLMERLLSLEVEMLGVIDIQTGTIYYYRGSDLDEGIRSAGNEQYADTLIQYAERCISLDGKEEFLNRMSLPCVLAHLPASDSVYGYSFWMRYAGQSRRKSGNFTYLDESKTTVIVMRSDTTDDYLQQEKRRNALDAAQAEVERAKLDGVTSIYNRVTIEAMIKEKLSDSGNGRCAFILLDLDDLKKINDSLGHLQGDRALRGIALTLKKHFPDTDILGRIGGDEFVVFQTGVEEGTALHGNLRTLLHELSQFRIGEGNNHAIHCSIGGAMGECGTDSFDKLYKRADTALYHVKRNGKNDYALYSEEMQAADYVHADHETVSLHDQFSINAEQLNRVMDAISTYYPLIVSTNLSQDRYFLMESGEGLVSSVPASGSCDHLFEKSLSVLHSEDGEAFGMMAREALVDAYESGKPSSQCRVRLLDKMGNAYRLIECTAVFYRNDDGDVCAFCFVRHVNQ